MASSKRRVTLDEVVVFFQRVTDPAEVARADAPSPDIDVRSLAASP
jgi:hypothetical protein